MNLTENEAVCADTRPPAFVIAGALLLVFFLLCIPSWIVTVYLFPREHGPHDLDKPTSIPLAVAGLGKVLIYLEQEMLWSEVCVSDSKPRLTREQLLVQIIESDLDTTANNLIILPMPTY